MNIESNDAMVLIAQAKELPHDDAWLRAQACPVIAYGGNTSCR